MISTIGRSAARTVAFGLALAAGQVVLDRAAPEGALPFALSSAVAQEKKQDERETRRTPALRNNVYEKLAEAQEAAEAKDWAKARKVLDDMLDDGGKNELNSYELANVWNLYAFVHYSNEDYDAALEAYKNVVRQPEIPLAMEVNTRYTVAQLLFVQERWREGIEALQQWFDLAENPTANAYVLLAQGYYQLQDFDKALANVEKAIDMYQEKGKLPKEQWYNLARFLHFERGNIDKTVDILETLLTYYPKKQYWVQLSHMYGEQKKDSEQLATMETAYVQDMLDKSGEQVTMAYLYLNGDVPYKAGKVLDKGLENGSIEPTSKNYEILGSAWRQAQETEWAIPAMEKAAEKADSGELFARLGNIYLDGEKYQKAVDAIERGLAKGGVKRPDTARLSLGMAYFNMDEYDKALKAFREAGKDDRSEQYARQWIKYMNSEIERQEELKKGL